MGNSRFSDGFLLGAIAGGALVFLVGTIVEVLRKLPVHPRVLVLLLLVLVCNVVKK